MSDPLVAAGISADLREVAVIVPARDEEDRIGCCLDALQVARRRCPVPTRVMVVVDSSADSTAELARRPGVDRLIVDHGRVGEARDAGARLAIKTASTTPSRLWLANTDADSCVPPDWLSFMVGAGNAGADLVLGTVLPELSDEQLARAWSAGHHLGDGHTHVHGANLGVRANVYVAVGGFPHADTGEDVRFAARVARDGAACVVSTAAVPVATSGRLVGRAPLGLAAYLRSLDAGNRPAAPAEAAG